MAEKEHWRYEKLDEHGRVKNAPINDPDGKITGKHIFGLKAWFDENPDERKRLGWVKHITHSTKGIEYDPATQYLAQYVKTIDEYTVEDEYRVMPKSEEMMRLEEINEYTGWLSESDEDLIWEAVNQ